MFEFGFIPINTMYEWRCSDNMPDTMLRHFFLENCENLSKPVGKTLIYLHQREKKWFITLHVIVTLHFKLVFLIKQYSKNLQFSQNKMYLYNQNDNILHVLQGLLRIFSYFHDKTLILWRLYWKLFNYWQHLIILQYHNAWLKYTWLILISLFINK